MGIDDDINIFWLKPMFSKPSNNAATAIQSKLLAPLWGQLVAIARINQDAETFRYDQQAVEGHGNSVQTIGLDELLPQNSRNQSKHTAAI